MNILKHVGSLVIICVISSIPAHAKSSKWHYISTKEPFDDTLIHGAMSLGNGGALTIISCHRNQLKVTLQTSHIDIRADSRRSVRYRVDSKPAVREDGIQHHKNGVAITGDPAVRLARAVRDAAKRFIVRNEAGTAEFGVKNSTATISKVLRACGLK